LPGTSDRLAKRLRYRKPACPEGRVRRGL